MTPWMAAAVVGVGAIMVIAVTAHLTIRDIERELSNARSVIAIQAEQNNVLRATVGIQAGTIVTQLETIVVLKKARDELRDDYLVCNSMLPAEQRSKP